MRYTTLCYIEKDASYLMLHRTKKEHDVNRDKWIGIGGSFEFGETPEECVTREMVEETGLEPSRLDYRGIVTFLYGNECEYMHLFKCTDFSGVIKECDEGELEWVSKDRLPSLELWEGDYVFLDLLEENVPFFSLKLCYDAGEKLSLALLNGQSIPLPYKKAASGDEKPKANAKNAAEKKEIEIYTDGSCRKNPGPGGWGAILVYGGREVELSGGEAETTNNRMELTAVIEALSKLKHPCRVTLTTDSKYVCDGISKGWAKNWRKKGWKKGDGSPALNPDLWEKLLSLCDTHEVKFVWVKGHAGHPYNERCDELAQAESGKFLI